MTHVPVMVQEVMAAFDLRPGAVVLDGTLGMGGHAKEMAKRISPGGTIVAIDWDKEMLQRARQELGELTGVNLRTFHSDYRDLPEKLAMVAQEAGKNMVADAVLLDLGLSNVHIEDPSYGISFLR